MGQGSELKITEPRIPRSVRCPHCGLRQPFRKQCQYWRTVRAPDPQHPVLWRVPLVHAKCRNPACPHRSFALPIPGVARYQRATSQLIQAGGVGLVADNTTLGRMATRFARSFNTTGSKSALDRWKHRVARQYDFPTILRRLGISGALCLDEYKPRRSGRYEQLAGDAKTMRLLYLDPVPEFYGRGVTAAFCHQLAGWGLQPTCVIFDLLTTFPKVVARVWPEAHQQFDHFHVRPWLWHYLRNALIPFRKSLRGPRWERHWEELWELKWGVLKPMDRWTFKERLLIPEMMEIYAGTVVEQVLLFKEALWDLFDDSQSKAEAYAKREALAREAWWRPSWHLTKCMECLLSESSTGWSPTWSSPRSPAVGSRKR